VLQSDEDGREKKNKITDSVNNFSTCLMWKWMQRISGEYRD